MTDEAGSFGCVSEPGRIRFTPKLPHADMRGTSHEHHQFRDISALLILFSVGGIDHATMLPSCD
jgi:hypothetical protein